MFPMMDVCVTANTEPGTIISDSKFKFRQIVGAVNAGAGSRYHAFSYIIKVAIVELYLYGDPFHAGIFLLAIACCDMLT
jgi:hypothetical protein